MLFTETNIKGAYLVEIKKLQDERGFFARSFCQHEFSEVGLDPCVAQCNVSFNRMCGTLRGMHYQLPPKAEAKLVRCTRGAIYDVVLDLRCDSPTFLNWTAETLTSDNYKMLYVPKGVAHGFITLEENTEIFYQMSEFYAPGLSDGVRWNDSLFKIEWPIEVQAISQKDQEYPDAVPEQFNFFVGLMI